MVSSGSRRPSRRSRRGGDQAGAGSRTSAQEVEQTWALTRAGTVLARRGGHVAAVEALLAEAVREPVEARPEEPQACRPDEVDGARGRHGSSRARTSRRSGCTRGGSLRASREPEMASGRGSRRGGGRRGAWEARPRGVQLGGGCAGSAEARGGARRSGGEGRGGAGAGLRRAGGGRGRAAGP